MKTATRIATSLVLFMVAFSSAFGQKKEKDDVYYFTDDKVKHSRLGVSANFTPMLTSRNLLLGDNAFTDGTFLYTRKRASGQFGYTFGGEVIVALSKSLDLRVGAQQSQGGFSYSKIDVTDLNGNLLGNATGTADFSSLDIPIKFVVHSDITDILGMEYGIGMELNFYQRYLLNYSYNGVDQSIDYSDQVTSPNYSVVIQLGVNFMPYDKVEFFTTPVFRYTIRTLVNTPDVDQETTYAIGMHLGVRYRF